MQNLLSYTVKKHNTRCIPFVIIFVDNNDFYNLENSIGTVWISLLYFLKPIYRSFQNPCLIDRNILNSYVKDYVKTITLNIGHLIRS